MLYVSDKILIGPCLMIYAAISKTIVRSGAKNWLEHSRMIHIFTRNSFLCAINELFCLKSANNQNLILSQSI